MAQERKPDIVLGEYWSDREHFADLYNAVLFGGEQVLSPDNLEERDSNVSGIAKTGARNKHGKKTQQSIKAVRDVLKVVKYSKEYDAEFAILGIENQNKIHYAMPLRVMEYDTRSYKKQYREYVRKNRKKGLTGDEFLSKMKQTEKLVPVITIVIYYGEKRWDGAKSLKEMLRIPPQIEAYVNDYPMHLVEFGNGGLPLQNGDNINLFEICRILYNQKVKLAERKKKIIHYVGSHEVGNEVLDAAGAVLGKEIEINEKEDGNMCSFFEELERECEERGILKNAVKVVGNAMRDYGLSLEAACKLAEISVEKYTNYVNTQNMACEA